MPRVRFEDVATRVNTREDRFDTDLVYYVGGDHIETGELTVSGRGLIKEADLGPMFYFGFKPGDILFVTRNPHLRKCATVDFPGICSEKTLVIGTKDETVLSQKYLAAVMQSDDFWEFMEENKSGSVNYFINWSTLAAYEFDLPPIEKQRQLADLLWAANDLKEAYRKAIAATDEMLKAKTRSIIDPLLGSGCLRALDELVENDRPICYGILMPGEEVPNGIPVVKVKDYPDGTIETKNLIHTSEDIDYEYRRSRLKAGDLLISIRGSVGRIAEVPDSLSDANITQDTARLSIKPAFNRQYIRMVLESEPMQDEMRKNTRGVAIKGINIGFLRQLMLPVASRKVQDQLGAVADMANKTKLSLKKSIADLDQVMKGLINESA